jgi:hypothetical protein
MKPEFKIDIAEGENNPLEAMKILSKLDIDVGYHIQNNVRPPLGIYNTSITRICDKLIKCCNKLEDYFNTSVKVDELRQESEVSDEVIDYIELALYAAAEHVDDLALIAKGFYPDKKLHKASKPAKQFESAVKKHKSLISASINAIKHQQSRIRMYSLEVKHGDIPHCLHGYFIEGVHDGVVGPNKIFHDNKREVFSVTSLIWEVICFVLNSSRHLCTFLKKVSNKEPCEDTKGGDIFIKAVISAARLPIYSFDETHPFSETKIVIGCSGEDHIKLDSKLYGAITNQWKSSGGMQFFNSLNGYQGDGVTKSFKIVKPMSVSLQHWS